MVEERLECDNCNRGEGIEFMFASEYLREIGEDLYVTIDNYKCKFRGCQSEVLLCVYCDKYKYCSQHRRKGRSKYHGICFLEFLFPNGCTRNRCKFRHVINNVTLQKRYAIMQTAISFFMNKGFQKPKKKNGKLWAIIFIARRDRTCPFFHEMPLDIFREIAHYVFGR